MVILEQQLEKLDEEKRKIHQKIKKRNKKRAIKCVSCDKAHEIGDLTVIQTHWYTPPSGCTDGDYWNEGELQFVCPETEIKNRLLFNNFEVPYEERRKFKLNPEAQFKSMYKGLFKEVIESYEKTDNNWVNNSYVDKHRKKFGLVEKVVKN